MNTMFDELASEVTKSNSPVRRSARELLALLGDVDGRRSNDNLAQLRETLAAYGLATNPDASILHVDAPLHVTYGSGTEYLNQQSNAECPPTSRVDAFVLTVGKIKLPHGNRPNAKVTGNILQIQRNTCVRSALARLVGISDQAPVIESGRIVGVVTMASLVNVMLFKPDCVERPISDAGVIASQFRTVDYTTRIVDCIDDLLDVGALYVLSPDGHIIDSLTPSDLSGYLMAQSRPYLLMGEIELTLREIVSHARTPNQLASDIGPKLIRKELERIIDLEHHHIEKCVNELVSAVTDIQGWSQKLATQPVEQAYFPELLARFIDWLESLKVPTKEGSEVPIKELALTWKSFRQDIQTLRNDIAHFRVDPLPPNKLDAAEKALVLLRSHRDMLMRCAANQMSSEIHTVSCSESSML